MFTLKIYWWYLPLILFLLPLVIIYFSYDKSNGFFSDITPLITILVCWVSAISIIIGAALITFI